MLRWSTRRSADEHRFAPEEARRTGPARRFDVGGRVPSRPAFAQASALAALREVGGEPRAEGGRGSAERDRDPAGSPGSGGPRRGDDPSCCRRRQREPPPGEANRLLDRRRAEEVDLELRPRPRTRSPLEGLDEPAEAELELLRFVVDSLRIRLLEQSFAGASKQKASHDVKRIERRVELRHRELQLSERFPAERERRGEAHAVSVRNLHDPVEHRADSEVIERSDAKAADEIGEVALERIEVKVHSRLVAGEHEYRFGEERRIVAREREQQEDQQLTQLRPELTDHAEIEEVDLLSRPEQVAGVRVGVEEAFNKNLAVERLD